jgi:hypothetical protein
MADKPAIADRARHPDELKGSTDLVIGMELFIKVLFSFCHPLLLF